MKWNVTEGVVDDLPAAMSNTATLFYVKKETRFSEGSQMAIGISVMPYQTLIYTCSKYV